MMINEDNYTVTEKADGDRNLLFIDDSGDCFLIDMKVEKQG